MRPFSQSWAAVLFENRERGGRIPRTGSDRSDGSQTKEVNLSKNKKKWATSKCVNRISDVRVQSFIRWRGLNQTRTIDKTWFPSPLLFSLNFLKIIFFTHFFRVCDPAKFVFKLLLSQTEATSSIHFLKWMNSRLGLRLLSLGLAVFLLLLSALQSHVTTPRQSNTKELWNASKWKERPAYSQWNRSRLAACWMLLRN